MSIIELRNKLEQNNNCALIELSSIIIDEKNYNYLVFKNEINEQIDEFIFLGNSRSTIEKFCNEYNIILNYLE